MNLQKGRYILRENCIFYLIGILIVLGIKYYYSQADCDSLLWILAPTAHWVELLSGIPFTYISGMGYVNHNLRMLIAPSCSGVQFMIITIATLVFSFTHNIVPPKKSLLPKAFSKALGGLGWIAASILFSWLFTIFINGLRIITAMYLPLYLDRAGLMGELVTPDRLHTMIGVVVYFTALLTLYRLVGYLFQRQKSLAILSPIFWYFFMTLGLPFLNRAYLKGTGKFAEYAILITCCLAMILVPYCLLSFLHSRRKNAKKQYGDK